MSRLNPKDRILHADRRYRCGRCGATPAWIHEGMGGSDAYAVEPQPDGRIALIDCGPDGHHGGTLWAVCRCGHTWTLRGVRSIDDISDPN